MNRIIAFMLLDFRTMPISLQSAIIFMSSLTILPPLFFFIHKNFEVVFAFLIIFEIFGVLTALNIFELEKKNRLETLYAMLSVMRNDIVTSHYLFAVCMILIVLLPAFPYCLIAPPLKMMEAIAGVLIGPLFISILYPIYFKWNSSMVFSFIEPVFKLGIGGGTIYACIKLLNPPPAEIIQITTTFSPLITMGLAIVIGCVLIYLSYLLSCKIYKKRDL